MDKADKFNVLVSDKLSEEGLEVFRQSENVNLSFDLEKDLQDAHALIIRSKTQVTKQILQDAKKLKLVGRAGIGVDNVDIATAKAKNIKVFNTPLGNTVTTAEHALALLFSTARHIPQACASMKQNLWEKSKFQGSEITGKTLGIIGLGNIGKEVAKRAHGLQMQVIAFDPIVAESDMLKLNTHKSNLEDLLKHSDFITIHAPFNKHTQNLVNTENINLMKNGVRIICAARGGIVNEADLLTALESGKVAAAALDVFETEPPFENQASKRLIQHPNLIATPHLGASTEEAQIRVGVQIARQTLDYLFRNKITHEV